MPELPEVETVMRGLQPSMEGEVITRADVNRPDLRWPFPDRMADRLSGRRVLSMRRRSKYILADLDSGETLLVHLGMSGRMTVSGDPLGQFVHAHPQTAKHDHVVLGNLLTRTCSWAGTSHDLTRPMRNILYLPG